MAKCKQCNIEILDETEVCPLCMSILEQTDEVENMYPDVRVKMRYMNLICNIYLFLALCTEAVIIYLDVRFQTQVWWSILTAVGLFYVYLVLRFAVVGKSGYRSKIITLTILAVLASVGIDMAIGYQGWSVDYVLPAGIVIVDIVILFLMYYNRRNWQSYIMWQILMVLVSIGMIFLFIFGIIDKPYLMVAAVMATASMFLGTLIFGDRRARVEVQRRFHIK